MEEAVKDKVSPGSAPLPEPREASPAEPLASRQHAGDDLEPQVVEVLRSVYDPEIPINVYDLGLVYDIDVAPGGRVIVRMTLTSPGCPVAGALVPEIESKVGEIPEVTKATVQLVWDPPWDMDKMSEAAKLQLGLD